MVTRCIAAGLTGIVMSAMGIRVLDGVIQAIAVIVATVVVSELAHRLVHGSRSC